ncbi:hypothetical protein STENM327S_03852 [Streptomyces tendae]
MGSPFSGTPPSSLATGSVGLGELLGDHLLDDRLRDGQPGVGDLAALLQHVASAGRDLGDGLRGEGAGDGVHRLRGVGELGGRGGRARAGGGEGGTEGGDTEGLGSRLLHENASS